MIRYNVQERAAAMNDVYVGLKNRRVSDAHIERLKCDEVLLDQITAIIRKRYTPNE